MKLGTALLFAILGGCAVHRELPAPAGDVRGAADDLRVVHEYRPAPTGADVLAVSYDHPPREYYKYFWGKGYYAGYRRERPRYFRRCD